MTHGSLPLHLRRLAIPASTGFLFTTMYNVVDTFWAGRLSTDSLAALSLNFPLYMLAVTLGVGFSAASGALIANALGANQEQESRRYFSQSVSLTLLFSAVTAIVFLMFLRPLFQLFHAEGAVLEGALGYGRIIIAGMPVLNMTPIFSSALAARGDTYSHRNALMAGFLLNIALDPLFMYTFGMEEAGVALATVLIQTLTAIFLLFRVRGMDGLQGLTRADYHPRGSHAGEIISQAIPASVNYLTMSLGTFVITWFIAAFGRDAVAAYGAAIRVEQIALVPTLGLNVALGSLVGQNNGAGKMDRVIASYKLSLLGGLLVMAIILPPVLIFGKSLIGLFTDTHEVVRMGYDYLLLQGITFYSYIILFQSNALLQGVKKPSMIMVMGVYRQIIAPAIVFSLFCFSFGMAEKGVWRGLILINWSAAIMTLLWAVKILKKIRE